MKPNSTHPDTNTPDLKRRAFVRGLPMLGVVGATALAGCDAAGAKDGGGDLDADLQLVEEAAVRETIAVATYTAAAESGLVTSEAVLATATAFAGHHTEHLRIFNDALTANGRAAVALESGEPDARIGTVASQTDAVELALTLEFEAAEAYFAQLGFQVSQPEMRRLFANVYPIEVAHYVQLRAALGRPAPIDAPLFDQLRNS